MDANNGARREPSSHKGMRQRLERMEGSLNAVPRAMEEAVEGLEAHCTAGVKLASLLETVFQDSPLLLLALRYKEACETLLDKSTRATLAMKGEVIAPVKRLGPTVSRLRSLIDSHAKASTRHESHVKQLEGVTLSPSATRSKQEQVEAKFRASAQEFAQEDRQLILATTEFAQLRTELMGGCFLGYLEAVSRVLESASDLLAPLGAYKELRHGLRDSPSSAALKDATVSWLAATQVNQNLRSFGGLSRNDVQCMLYQHSDGLPDNIRTGLNGKVDQLIKLYSSELAHVESPHHVVTGGFHFNPKAIELALKDCCSELEAKGAGADHAYSLEDKEEQISCDVPRTLYLIGDQKLGAATGEHASANVLEKKSAVRQLLTCLSAVSSPQPDKLPLGKQLLDDFAEYVINESCTTVTNTTAKTAVQLVFGKANLILVRPSPSSEDNKPIEIAARKHDSTLTITVHSSWWLVEDYAAFAMLQRPADPSEALGVVDARYSIALCLENFCSESPVPELPSVAVTCRQPSSSSANTSPPQPIVGSREKERLLGSFTTLRNKFRIISQKTRSRLDGSRSPQRGLSPRGGATLRTFLDEEGGRGEGGRGEGGASSPRKASTDSEGTSEPPTPGGGYTGARYSSSGRSDSFGRGVRPAYHRHGMKRSESNDTLNSQSTQSTIVPRPSLLESDDHPQGIADLIRGPSRPTLTQSRIWAHDKSASPARDRHHGYRGYGRPGEKAGKEGDRADEDEEEEEEEAGGDDRQNNEGSPSNQEISIVSDMEMERVFTLLSKNPQDFEQAYQRYPYEGPHDDGYQREGPHEREVGFGGHRGDEYSPSSTEQYGYKYGYGSRDYRSQGYSDRAGGDRGYREDGYRGEGRRERGHTEEGRRERGHTEEGRRERGHTEEGRRERGHTEEGRRERGDNSSSGSSGIEEHYSLASHRSRSGSAASLHTDREPGKEADRGRGEGAGGGPRRGPGGSSASLVSMDSGIGGAARKQAGRDRGRGEVVDAARPQHGPHSQDLPFDFSKGLGSLIPTDPRHEYDYHMFVGPGMERSGRDNLQPPVSSSSSGSTSPVMFRTRSEENIRLPERSASRSSTHSVPPGALQGHGSSTTLNDFDHTPGSRPRPFDYEDRLSQDSLDGRQYWNYPQQEPPSPEQFGHPPYNYNMPPGDPHGGPPGGPHGGPPGGPHGGPPGGPHGGPHGGPPGGPHGGPYNYDGDYGERLHAHERHSRSLQQSGRGHSEDYPPSPGPPLDHRHHPPQYWHGPGYEGRFDRPLPQGNPRGPPGPMPPPHPGPPGGRMNPSGPHPMHDNRFRPVQFRPNTPSSPSPASLHSMSPAPSPHPTPPPTPPPPHGPLRPLQPHGPPPPMPGPYHSPRGHMHPPRDFHPPLPPQPGIPHGHQGPLPPREPNFGPHPPPRFGLSPSPGPPISSPGRFPPGPPWGERGWGPH